MHGKTKCGIERACWPDAFLFRKRYLYAGFFVPIVDGRPDLDVRFPPSAALRLTPSKAAQIAIATFIRATVPLPTPSALATFFMLPRCLGWVETSLSLLGQGVLPTW
jgi:hypothetical protein